MRPQPIRRRSSTGWWNCRQSTGNITDREAYKKALYAREAEASTYVDNGITVPHARTACVTRPSLAAMRLAAPVQYNAEDDGKTDLLVCHRCAGKRQLAH